MTFVAFDTETTGLNPDECELLEVSGVKITVDEDCKISPVMGEYSCLMKIEGDIPEAASKVNHITKDMIELAPHPKDAIRGFFKWVGVLPIMVAHHAAFDVSFLGRAVKKHGLMLPMNPVVCSKRMAIRYFPEIRHRLQDLEGAFLNKNSYWSKYRHTGQKHRALYDAHLCAQVFVHMMNRIPKKDRNMAWCARNMPVLGGPLLKFSNPPTSQQLEAMYAELELKGA